MEERFAATLKLPKCAQIVSDRIRNAAN